MRDALWLFFDLGNTLVNEAAATECRIQRFVESFARYGRCCQCRRENVSAGRSKTASRRGAKCPTGRFLLRAKQDEKRIASPAKVPETSRVASPSVLPSPQLILRLAPAPLLNPQINAY